MNLFRQRWFGYASFGIGIAFASAHIPHGNYFMTLVGGFLIGAGAQLLENTDKK